MRYLLLLVAAAISGTTAELNVVHSCGNQSCVFTGLDPCVEHTVLVDVSTRSVELQFDHNLTSCGTDEPNDVVTVWEVRTDSNYSNQDLPLLVTAQQLSNGQTQTWTLPDSIPLFNDTNIESVSKVICPNLNMDSVNHPTDLIINVLSRNSSTPFAVNISVFPVKQFNISSLGEYNISVDGILSPQVRYYQFPESMDTVFISFLDVDNSSSTCMVVSIQDASCPVTETLDSTHLNSEQFFTMSHNASILVQKKDFPGGEIFLSFIPVPSSSCLEGDVNSYNDQTYQKGLLVTVEESYVGSFSSNPLSIALPFILAVGMLCLSLLSIASPWEYCGWSWNDLRYKRKAHYQVTMADPADARQTMDEEDRQGSTVDTKDRSHDTVYVQVENNDAVLPEDRQDDNSRSNELQKSSVIIHMDYDDVLKLSGSKVRLFHMVQNPELAQKYNAYFWYTLATGILYMLPALQALLYLLEYKSETGNLDLCYYNFKCAVPVDLRGVSAFNNVYSNLAFVLLGIVFIAFIYIRSLVYNRWRKWLQKQKTEQPDFAPPPPAWVLSIRKRLDNIERRIQQLKAAQKNIDAGSEVTHSLEAAQNNEDVGSGVTRSLEAAQKNKDVGNGVTCSLTGVRLTRREEMAYLIKERTRLEQEKERIESFGVPQFTGIYYATGFALVMEGIMGGIYHLCPNHANFQFDTTFMYILTGIVIIKVMMLRHPDLFTRAHLAFVAFAGILLLAFIGLTNDSQALTVIIYLILFLISVVMVVSYTFYNPLEWHGWSFFKKLVKGQYCVNYWKSLNCQSLKCKRDFCTRRFIWKLWRLLWIPIYVSVNLTLLLILSIRNIRVTRGILALLIVNLCLLMVGYLIAKFIAKERWTVVTILWVILGFAFWVPAMLFFIPLRVYDTNLTPAGSRELNQDCVTDLFYDYHDMWHILSALAIYATSMGIVTIDDGIVQNSILEIRSF